MSKDGNGFLAGIIVGAVVGAATALFLSPKTKEQVGSSLRPQMLRLKEWGEDVILNKDHSEEKSLSIPLPDHSVAKEQNEVSLASDELFRQKLKEAEEALQEEEQKWLRLN